MKAFVVEVVTPTGLPITQVRTEADDPVEAGKQVTGSDDLCCEDYGYPGTLRAKVYDEVEEETWIYRMYDPIDGDEQDEDH